MSDYIKREDALKAVDGIHEDDLPRNNKIEVCDVLTLVVPSADVAPVRHGRWVTTYRYGFPIWECSECGIQTGTANFPYCFNCGAKMDEEVDA